MKILKRLPNDGPMTWVAGSFAGRPPRKYEVHPSVEEAWLLEGEFNLAECLPEGLKVWHMTGGSYFYRPPNIRHIGPNSGSRTYAIWLSGRRRNWRRNILMIAARRKERSERRPVNVVHSPRAPKVFYAGL